MLSSLVGEDELGAGVAVWLPFALLLLSGLVGLARLRKKDGNWWPASVRERLAAVLHLSLQDLAAIFGAPKTLVLFVSSRFARGAGFAGLAVASGLGVVQHLAGHGTGSKLAGLSLWSASLLFGSELLRCALGLQSQRRPVSRPDLALAVQEFPPLVDLSQPLEVETIFLHPTPLHRVLQGLSTWRSSGQWLSADNHAAALQRHLWRCIPDARLERRRWLGTSRAQGVADLVVDDAVLIDIQLGFDRASVQRLIERVRSYQRGAWQHRPVVVVVCEPGNWQLLDTDLVDALVALHDSQRLIVALAR